MKQHKNKNFIERYRSSCQIKKSSTVHVIPSLVNIFSNQNEKNKTKMITKCCINIILIQLITRKNINYDLSQQKYYQQFHVLTI